MIKKIEGMVVSEIPYGETSKIINIFTKEYGIIGIMAKGAHQLKSKLRSTTTKFTYGYFHVYYKEDKLSTLIECELIDDLRVIKTDIILVSYLNYITELATQVYKESKNKEIYNIYIEIVKKLNQKLNPLILTNILEIKLLDYLGVSLNLDGCIKCGNKTNIVTIDGDAGGYVCQNCYTNEIIYDKKVIQLLRLYYYVDIKSITELNIKIDLVNIINNFLNKYYDRYTGLYLNSKNFLKTITNV